MDTCMDGWQTCRLSWAIGPDLFVHSETMWDTCHDNWSLAWYLSCVLTYEAPEAHGGIFRHLPLSSEYSVSLMRVCILYKHCGLSGTPLGRSIEGGSLQFDLFPSCLQTCFENFPLTQTVSCWETHEWQRRRMLSPSLCFGTVAKWGAVKVQTQALPHKHSEVFQGLWLESPALLCLFGLVPLPVIAYLWNLPKLFYIPIYTRAIAVCSYKGQCVQM